ncbi:hypothetical protein AKJ16_DCAP13783 [Drosera capensis]
MFRIGAADEGDENLASGMNLFFLWSRKDHFYYMGFMFMISAGWELHMRLGAVTSWFREIYACCVVISHPDETDCKLGIVARCLDCRGILWRVKAAVQAMY